MAQKTLYGKVVSTKMNGSAVVEVTSKTPHPLYKKLLTRSKKYIVDVRGKEVKEGEFVTIVERRKMAGNKHFAVAERKTE